MCEDYDVDVEVEGRIIEQRLENAAIRAHLEAGGQCWFPCTLADVTPPKRPEPPPFEPISDDDIICPICGHMDPFIFCIHGY